MSPIEIAKAFNAPLFKDIPGNLNARQIVDIMNKKRPNLRVAYVVTPQSDMMEEGRFSGDRTHAGRLEMRDVTASNKPAEGEFYV